MEYRKATARDAEAIARLHADSWRRNYRGAYSDAFLDGDVLTDRLALWRARLTEAAGDRCTLVAGCDGSVVGFAHVLLDADPTWGALLDNLHVTHTLKRRGIGARLVAETAAAVLRLRPSTGLYLWVLEQNTAGQAFYEALGGRRVERGVVPPPGGNPSRLCGAPACLRYVWPDPSTLVAQP